MRRGRRVQILGLTEADGVKFYRVSAPPNSTGWLQADAVFGRFRIGDEERLARLVQASDGFDRIELAARERLEVELTAIGDVKLEWNGEAVVPQGRQDAPRRLVFIDDSNGAW